MLNNTVLQVRIDAQLKKNAEELFEQLGITFADAVRMFAVKAVDLQAMPFEISKSTPVHRKLHASGIANEYADTSKIENEKEAWLNVVKEKYADFRC